MTCARLHLTALAAAAALAGCATAPSTPPEMRTVSIQRTAFGVPHISAPDLQTLAYGVAYAHAEDNVCQTAQQLVTVRGERSRYFGGTHTGLLGRRIFPNEWVDFFIAVHMDDAALAAAWAHASADTQALVRGYVAGYNRYLQDKAATLPAACKDQPWVQPMTQADYYRLNEVASVQSGIVALADAVLAAQPPKASAAAPAAAATVTLADARQALREAGLVDSPLGSNAWAFGKDSTANGSGLLLGNPHFPWVGVNRFWQMHLTVPGKLDVMGAATGHSPVVQIGFNKDLAWTHTVSTGKRFTLHELKLVPGDATSYLVDGQPEKMRSRTVQIAVRGGDGNLTQKPLTHWSTRWGPVISMPRAGLNWTANTAYALQDANTGNARSIDTWLGFATAASVQDMRKALANLGMPWVNTIAADRQGQALYADVSVVPDVDAAQLARCAPSAPAAALRGGAGLIVLDGSRSDCGWQRDPSSAVPGLIAAERLPAAIRSDWVQNTNDSFFYTHPQQAWPDFSPLVGDDILRRPRTRSSLLELPELLARGPVTAAGVQAQIFSNRNLMARAVLPDLLAACAGAPPSAEARDGCAALRGWDRLNNLDSRGAHLFRLFWRGASAVPGVYRLPFDKAQPLATPAGLKMDDAAVAAKVWEVLAQAVKALRTVGIKLDAPLGTVQHPLITEEGIALHGGDEIEGVLNNLGHQFGSGLSSRGLLIDYGTSYVQTVSFDARGPVAQGLLTYGQSTNPASPHVTDQMKLYSAKQWPALPFHAEDVARQRVGEVLRLTRP